MRSTKNKMLLLLKFIAVCGIPAAVKGGHVEVISRGFPGKPMTSINRTWLERETKGNFNCVVLLLGTNDACNSKVLSDEKTFEKALNFTVDTILAKKCKLVLLTIAFSDGTKKKNSAVSLRISGSENLIISLLKPHTEKILFSLIFMLLQQNMERKETIPCCIFPTIPESMTVSI